LKTEVIGNNDVVEIVVVGESDENDHPDQSRRR